jgi:hypothetical protein
MAPSPDDITGVLIVVRDGGRPERDALFACSGNVARLGNSRRGSWSVSISSIAPAGRTTFLAGKRLRHLSHLLHP